MEDPAVRAYHSWVGYLPLVPNKAPNDLIWKFNGSPDTATVTFSEKELVIYVLEKTAHLGIVEVITFQSDNEVDVYDIYLKFRYLAATFVFFLFWHPSNFNFCTQ